MTKGFSINDILDTPKNKAKKNQINLKDYEPGSNYQSNITLGFKSYHAFDHLNIGSSTVKSSFQPTITTKYNYDAAFKMPHAQHLPHHIGSTKPKELNTGTPGWSFPTSKKVDRERIPQHKLGQVEATRKSKPRKTQTVFSAMQISELELWYDKCNYINTEDRHALAKRLGMSSPQVKNWFQNKRNKERKMGNNPNRNNINLRPGHLHPSDYEYLQRSLTGNATCNVLRGYSNSGGFYR